MHLFYCMVQKKMVEVGAIQIGFLHVFIFTDYPTLYR